MYLPEVGSFNCLLLSAPGGQERGGAELSSPLSRASSRQGERVPSGGHCRQLGTDTLSIFFTKYLYFELRSNLGIQLGNLRAI